MRCRLPLGPLLAGSLLVTACSSPPTSLERADAAPAPPPVSSTTTAPAPPPAAGPSGASAAPSAAALAALIADDEELLRTADVGSAAVEAAAFDLQLRYRQLARQPDWEPAVLAALPAAYRDIAWANAAARREFRSMHSTLSDTLPAWRIVDPAPAEDLLTFYREGESTYGVPWEVLAAVNLVETGMGRIRGTSIAGAQGPMQFMPATWDAFGTGDVDDPHDAILAAARYLAHNGAATGDLDNALYRYNHSSHYVRGVRLYADVMAADPQSFVGFYHWQVVYLSALGDIWLPTGYDQDERIAVRDYVRAHPDRLLGTATG